MKLKSHSGTKKRIRKTGSGKLMTDKSSKRHLLKNKSTKAKASFKDGKPVDVVHAKRMQRLLPN